MKNFIYLPLLLLTGCSLHNSQIVGELTDMQSFALCQTTDQAKNQKEKILAEYGFKRFAKNTYRPLLKQRLLGHEIRVITIEPNKHKLYVAGNPKEFQHHFSYTLKGIECKNNICQAKIDDFTQLHMHKPKIKKAKDTTVIECTRTPPAKAE